MNTFTPTGKDISQAERIRRQYLAKEANKTVQLQKLDAKVKAPGQAISSIVGVLGALVMGGGMSMTMLNGNMKTGIFLGVAGMVVAAVAYPVYTVITNSRKKKYAADILRISGEIVGE